MAEPELKGPIKGVRFVHRAILNEALDFRDTAMSLAVDDENGAAGLKERLAAFERVLKTHEDSEDIAIFPALQAKYPFITDTYEYDHRRHRKHASGLEQTLYELGSARGSRRGELVRLLGEQSVEFNAFMVLHIDKEDELLFPAYDEMFSVEEQEQHGQAAQGQIPPEAMAAAGVWAFQRLDAEYREGFLRLMMGMMPPPAFAGLAGGLARSVPDSDWQEMLRRIPNLQPRAA
jgi:hemerythrin-like domain-containing protein